MRGCNGTHILPQKGPINNPVKPLTISSVLRRLVNHQGFIQSDIISCVCVGTRVCEKRTFGVFSLMKVRDRLWADRKLTIGDEGLFFLVRLFQTPFQ